MKGLPHSREAEQAILGRVLLYGRQAFIDTELRAEDFYIPQHQTIWNAMTALVDRQEEIDTVTVEAQLRTTNEHKVAGGIVYLNKLTDAGMSRAKAQHVKIIRDFAVLRSIVLTSQEIAEEGMGGEVADVGEYRDRAEQRLLDLRSVNQSNTLHTARELAPVTFKNLAERLQRGSVVTGIPTGYADLDSKLAGLQLSDLIIVAARPSMGKTAFVLSITQNVAIVSDRTRNLFNREEVRPCPVLFFSLEMSAGQLMTRLLCAEAGVGGDRFRTGMVLADDFRELTQATERIAKAPIWIDDQAAPTILEMRARARRFRANKQIFPERTDKQAPHGLVVVDYLQLARGGAKRYQSREQEVSDISRGLKAMAKELNVPVLALSQLSRAPDLRADHRPQLSDLRESGSIEQDADVVLFLYRPERYEQDEAKRRELQGQAEVIIGKQRNGDIGTVHMTFRNNLTRFESRAYGPD